MVVKITKEDLILIDGIEKQIKDIDSAFLNSLFFELLKKTSSIIIEDENNCGYVGKMFLDLKKATSDDSDFSKEYNSIKKDYNDLKQLESELDKAE